MSNWRIFQGDNPEASESGRMDKIPDAPNWRPTTALLGDSQPPFSPMPGRQQQRGRNFRATNEQIEMVNAALYLRRPLLITGNPGVGKSSLPYAVAYELGLGEVLYWSITTRTVLQDGLYTYDAIGRLQDPAQKDSKNLSNIGKYIQLGALGTALYPTQLKRPRVLLIDEIDKGDIDLPNDLLCVFEEGGFNIRELTRIKEELPGVGVQSAYSENDSPFEVLGGRINCTEFPFIVLTSNGERDFPAPFLRRCIRLTVSEPDEGELTRIVKANLGEVTDEVATLIHDFYGRREEMRDRGNLATDQLLNAIYLISKGKIPDDESRKVLLDRLLKPLSSSEDS
jgi:MoxR-like ATPase